MFGIKKLVGVDDGEGGVTQTEEDAGILELVDPSVPLDATGGWLRAAVHVAGAASLTSKLTTGSWIPRQQHPLFT